MAANQYSLHFVGPSTFLQVDNADGPFTLAGTTMVYVVGGSPRFYFAATDPNPSPFHVIFFSIFRIAIDITPETTLNCVTINGAGADFECPPVPDDGSVITGQNVPITITLNATDVDHDPLQWGIVSGPSHGVLGGLAFNPTNYPDYHNEITYTPALDYIGPDSFVFAVNDTHFPEVPATISIDVVGIPPGVLSCDQLVLELVYDAAIYAPFSPPDDWPPIPPGGGGDTGQRGPGECAGVGYGIGFVGGPGGIAGTGDPMSTMAIDLKQFFGGGSPPALGFLYAYAAGSLTQQDTFSNSSLATPNVWPIQLDANGNSPTPVFLGPFIYKFDVQDANGASLAGFPKDNIAGSVWPGQVLGAVTVNPIANADAAGHRLSATLNKASSGTHALFTGLYVQAPTIGGGAGTLTEASSLYVAGAPGGGTNRYAVHVEQGNLLLTDDASSIGFFGATPVAQQLVPTGSTTDQVIAAMQALGLFKQA